MAVVRVLVVPRLRENGCISFYSFLNNVPKIHYKKTLNDKLKVFEVSSVPRLRENGCISFYSFLNNVPKIHYKKTLNDKLKVFEVSSGFEPL